MTAPNDLKEYIGPIIVKRHEAVDVPRAMEITGLSEKTIRRLFDEYQLGAKLGKNSRLSISEPALLMVWHGDFVALELLREGKRNHPSVQRYFVQCGLVYIAPKKTKALEPPPRPEWRRLKDLTAAELQHALAANPELHQILDLHRNEYANVAAVGATPLAMAEAE